MYCKFSSSPGDAASLSTTATHTALHLLTTPTEHRAPADGDFSFKSFTTIQTLLNSGGFVAVMLGLEIKTRQTAVTED